MGSAGGILGKTKKADFFDLVDACGDWIDIDRDAAYVSIEESIASFKGGNHADLQDDNLIKQLENRWYASLSGAPDYQVYSDPYYICDIWLCWVMFSSKGIRAIASPRSLVTRSVVEHMGDVKMVVDLGCGFGYTAAALKETFPEAVVVGTNIPDSYQYKVARKFGSQYGFTMATDICKLKGSVDIVLASEYFEHIVNPIEHAHAIITAKRPRFFVIANGFNGTAIGHFHEYRHQGHWYPAASMSKMFWVAMRMMGYKKLKTKIWNSRPAVWEARK